MADPGPWRYSEPLGAGPDYRRWVRVGTVTVMLVLGAIAWPFYRTNPHGDPDPGGRRLANLTSLAEAALPADAERVRLSRGTPHWTHQTCDGSAPGWTGVEVVERFDAPRTAIAHVDGVMRHRGWHPVGGARTHDYEPARSGDYYASLYAGQRGSAFSYELDLSAAPAELAASTC